MTKAEAIALAKEFNSKPYYQSKPDNQRWRIAGNEGYYIITTDDTYVAHYKNPVVTKYI